MGVWGDRFGGGEPEGMAVPGVTPAWGQGPMKKG